MGVVVDQGGHKGVVLRLGFGDNRLVGVDGVGGRHGGRILGHHILIGNGVLTRGHAVGIGSQRNRADLLQTREGRLGVGRGEDLVCVVGGIDLRHDLRRTGQLHSRALIFHDGNPGHAVVDLRADRPFGLDAIPGPLLDDLEVGVAAVGVGGHNRLHHGRRALLSLFDQDGMGGAFGGDIARQLNALPGEAVQGRVGLLHDVGAQGQIHGHGLIVPDDDGGGIGVLPFDGLALGVFDLGEGESEIFLFRRGAGHAAHMLGDGHLAGFAGIDEFHGGHDAVNLAGFALAGGDKAIHRLFGHGILDAMGQALEQQLVAMLHLEVRGKLAVFLLRKDHVAIGDGIIFAGLFLVQGQLDGDGEVELALLVRLEGAFNRLGDLQAAGLLLIDELGLGGVVLHDGAVCDLVLLDFAVHPDAVRLIVFALGGLHLFDGVVPARGDAGDQHAVLRADLHPRLAIDEGDAGGIAPEAGGDETLFAAQRPVLIVRQGHLEGEPGGAVGRAFDALLQLQVAGVDFLGAVGQHGVLVLNLVLAVGMDFRAGVLGFAADDGAAEVTAQIRHDGVRRQQHAGRLGRGADLAGIGMGVAKDIPGDEVEQHLGGILVALAAEVSQQPVAVNIGIQINGGRAARVGHIDVDHDIAPVVLEIQAIIAVDLVQCGVDDAHGLAVAGIGQLPGQAGQAVPDIAFNVQHREGVFLAGQLDRRLVAAVRLDQVLIIILVSGDDDAVPGFADHGVQRHIVLDIAEVVVVDIDVFNLNELLGELDVRVVARLYDALVVLGEVILLAAHDLGQHIGARGQLVKDQLHCAVIAGLARGRHRRAKDQRILAGHGIELQGDVLIGHSFAAAIHILLDDLYAVDLQVVAGEAVVRADLARQMGRADVGFHVGGVQRQVNGVQAEVGGILQIAVDLALGDTVHVLLEVQNVVDQALAICDILVVLALRQIDGVAVDGIAEGNRVVAVGAVLGLDPFAKARRGTLELQNFDFNALFLAREDVVRVLRRILGIAVAVAPDPAVLIGIEVQHRRIRGVRAAVDGQPGKRIGFFAGFVGQLDAHDVVALGDIQARRVHIGADAVLLVIGAVQANDGGIVIEGLGQVAGSARRQRVIRLCLGEHALEVIAGRRGIGAVGDKAVVVVVIAGGMVQAQAQIIGARVVANLLAGGIHVRVADGEAVGRNRALPQAVGGQISLVDGQHGPGHNLALGAKLCGAQQSKHLILLVENLRADSLRRGLSVVQHLHLHGIGAARGCGVANDGGVNCVHLRVVFKAGLVAVHHLSGGKALRRHGLGNAGDRRIGPCDVEVQLVLLLIEDLLAVRGDEVVGKGCLAQARVVKRAPGIALLPAAVDLSQDVILACVKALRSRAAGGKLCHPVQANDGIRVADVAALGGHAEALHRVAVAVDIHAGGGAAHQVRQHALGGGRSIVHMHQLRLIGAGAGEVLGLLRTVVIALEALIDDRGGAVGQLLHKVAALVLQAVAEGQLAHDEVAATRGERGGVQLLLVVVNLKPDGGVHALGELQGSGVVALLNLEGIAVRHGSAAERLDVHMVAGVEVLPERVIVGRTGRGAAVLGTDEREGHGLIVRGHREHDAVVCLPAVHGVGLVDGAGEGGGAGGDLLSVDVFAVGVGNLRVHIPVAARVAAEIDVFRRRTVVVKGSHGVVERAGLLSGDGDGMGRLVDTVGEHIAVHHVAVSDDGAAADRAPGLVVLFDLQVLDDHDINRHIAGQHVVDGIVGVVVAVAPLHIGELRAGTSAGNGKGLRVIIGHVAVFTLIVGVHQSGDVCRQAAPLGVLGGVQVAGGIPVLKDDVVLLRGRRDIPGVGDPDFDDLAIIQGQDHAILVKGLKAGEQEVVGRFQHHFLAVDQHGAFGDLCHIEQLRRIEGDGDNLVHGESLAVGAGQLQIGDQRGKQHLGAALDDDHPVAIVELHGIL